MTANFKDEFAELANLVKTANLLAPSGQTVLWCLEQLPSLYEQLCQTYETRYSEKIVRLEQGILVELAEATKRDAAAPGLADDMAERLRTLHERHGLHSLDPKPRKAVKPSAVRTRKTAKKSEQATPAG